MSKIQSIRRKSILVAAAAVSAGLVYTGAAQATARTWNGGGIDNNWTTAFNWSPAAAPVSGDTLTFDGFGRLTNTNDVTGAVVINGVTFAASAGAFTIGGNQITLGGSIVDNTTILSQSLNLPLLLSGNRSVQVVDGGSLRLGGVISDGGGGFGLTKTGLGVL